MGGKRMGEPLRVQGAEDSRGQVKCWFVFFHVKENEQSIECQYPGPLDLSGSSTEVEGIFRHLRKSVSSADWAVVLRITRKIKLP